MNILFFSRLFYPHIGGVEKHVLEISRLLIKKGHKVSIVCESHDSGLALTEKKDDIKIYRISVGQNNWFRKLRIWREIWKLRNLIKTSNIVHCHDVFFWYLPFRFIYLTKNVFTTFHGYENYPLKSKEILMHKIAEILSVGNICIGHFMKKWYKTKPNFVSYGGANIVQSENRPASPRGEKAKSENSAVFIGRLDEQTGILTYVKAVEIIRKKIPSFDFLVIGDGKHKNKIDKKIKILKPQDQATKYFKNYNFAFVSRYLSILEAMAAKRLVFAVYDNPLKEDYLRLAPFSKYITISNSSSELVSKIYSYLHNLNGKEKIIDDAYNWVAKQTWEKVTNDYLKLWKIES